MTPSAEPAGESNASRSSLSGESCEACERSKSALLIMAGTPYEKEHHSALARLKERAEKAEALLREFALLKGLPFTKRSRDLVQRAFEATDGPRRALEAGSKP